MDKNFVTNNCTSNPGLAIHGAGSALVKTSNTTFFKANGRDFYFTAQDCPSLALATLVSPFPNGTPTLAGNLAFDDGTVPASTNSCRIYTLVATLPLAENPTVALSWLAGADFPKHRQSNAGDFAHPSGSNQVEIGWLYVKNETSAVFVPGTTALDTASITTTYTNNYAQVGA